MMRDPETRARDPRPRGARASTRARSARRSGAAVSSFVAFALGALVPLMPWFFGAGAAAAIASIVLGVACRDRGRQRARPVHRPVACCSPRRVSWRSRWSPRGDHLRRRHAPSASESPRRQESDARRPRRPGRRGATVKPRSSYSRPPRVLRAVDVEHPDREAPRARAIEAGEHERAAQTAALEVGIDGDHVDLAERRVLVAVHLRPAEPGEARRRARGGGTRRGRTTARPRALRASSSVQAPLLGVPVRRRGCSPRATRLRRARARRRARRAPHGSSSGSAQRICNNSRPVARPVRAAITSW